MKLVANDGKPGHFYRCEQWSCHCDERGTVWAVPPREIAMDDDGGCGAGWK